MKCCFSYITGCNEVSVSLHIVAERELRQGIVHRGLESELALVCVCVCMYVCTYARTHIATILCLRTCRTPHPCMFRVTD